MAACGEEDVDFAVLKAREAFEDGRWSKLHPSERKDTLIRFAKLITRNRRELAVMESLDSGKTIYDCETVDVPETIHCLKWHAEAIDKIYDQVSPASDDHIAMIVREPVGVVGLVLPWNFPLLMLAWKSARRWRQDVRSSSSRPKKHRSPPCALRNLPWKPAFRGVSSMSFPAPVRASVNRLAGTWMST